MASHCLRNSSLTKCSAAAADFAELRFCKDLTHVTHILPPHPPPLINEFLPDPVVLAFAKCGRVQHALHSLMVFPRCSVFSWTALISVCSDSGRLRDAITIYRLMQEYAMQPNHYTLVSLLKVCGNVQDIMEGQKLHAFAFCKGLAEDIFVACTLVSMYGKCRALFEAEVVFTSFPERNIVLWNAMLSVYVQHSLGEKALLLYRQMQDETASANRVTFVNVLHACVIIAKTGTLGDDVSACARKLLLIGQCLHALLHKGEHLLDASTITALVNMYSKCGSVQEAEDAFSALPEPDIISWNTMLSAYLEHDQALQVLYLYRHMQAQGLQPNKYTMVFALKACGLIAEKGKSSNMDGLSVKAVALAIGKALHVDACTKEWLSDHFVGTSLLSMYRKCGDIIKTEEVFIGLHERDIVAWNAMLSAYVEHGFGERALHLYRQMQEESVEPNEMTSMIACKACIILTENEEPDLVQGQLIKVRSLEIGQSIFCDAQRKEGASFSTTSLIILYGKCGAVSEAEQLFASLSQQDVVLWTSLLSTYVETNRLEKALQLYRQMQEKGLRPSQHSVVCALKACCNFEHMGETLCIECKLTRGRALEICHALYADARMNGFLSDPIVNTAFLTAYSGCGLLLEAEQVFCAMFQPDIVSWNAMLSAYLKRDKGDKVLQLYRQMRAEGGIPDQMTLALAIHACGLVRDVESCYVTYDSTRSMYLDIGQALHAFARQKKDCFFCNKLVPSALVKMYSRCGTDKEVENLISFFLYEGQVESLNSILDVYIEQGRGEKTFQLYRVMFEHSIKPDASTFVMMLEACCMMVERENTQCVMPQCNKAVLSEIGHALHIDAVRGGYASEVSVAHMIMIMYSTCGNLEKAEGMLSICQPTPRTWNDILSVCIRHHEEEKVLYLYKQMQKNNITFFQDMFIYVLQACSETGNLELCQSVHFNILSGVHDLISTVAASLIQTYGKCANVADSQAIFENFKEPDTAIWTACIQGYATVGDAVASSCMHEKLKLEDLDPDEIFYSCMLLASCHDGLVTQCIKYFESMTIDNDIIPQLRHYGLLIDALGRAGDFLRMKSMLMNMPMEVDFAIYMSVLTACRAHGNLELAEIMFDQIVEATIEVDKSSYV